MVMNDAFPVLDDVEVWIFDLDNTLYPPHCNLFEQVDRRMAEFISRFLGIDRTAARRLQKRYFREHGTTLNGLMINHGLEPDGYLEYVHDIDVSPVPPSPELDAALARLPGRKIVYTNGSRAHAERVMHRLGVAARFEDIFDIVAADYRPKPDPAAYRALVARFAIDPVRAVMVEDIPRNLEPAHALGMTTVWVRRAHAWSTGGEEGAHIHHTTDDLVAWLEAVAPPTDE